MPHKGIDSKMSSENISHEQPVIKRQRIENDSLMESITPDTGSNSSSTSSLIASTSSSSSTSLASSTSSSPSSSKLLVVADHHADDHNDYQSLYQDSIAKQCLCGIEMNVLKRSFQTYYSYSTTSVDKSGPKKLQYPLIEWPFEYLLKFLSNIQLLFDTYLKQNIKGNICSSIMDLCNYLIRNETLNSDVDVVMNIDEIISLCNYNNKFINYLSGRILSSFLIIIKDELDDRWLEKIVANLFDFNNLDILAVKKINFSLDIIKRIVEWKDDTEHPLEDDMHINNHNNGGAGNNSNHMTTIATPSSASFIPPPIENNYFATQFNAQYNTNASTNIFASPSSSSSSSSQSLSMPLNSFPSPASTHLPQQHQMMSSSPSPTSTCHIVTLTDSESFDTTRIKCETISILGNKWPALVKNISQLIKGQNAQTHIHNNLVSTESCTLTFLGLWESIISVKANLSIVETLPFYSQLDKFQLLLLATKNSIIYKEMLTLFNEALCYGSTLALQDLLPEEVCSLAHNIVRSVKDYRILDSLPRATYANNIGFIGYKGETVHYNENRFSTVDTGASASNGATTVARNNDVTYDKTILQKITLLVLKAVAVIVKEIRSDSSDSSVDSSDYDMQDMQVIERSIRDVVKKLETFMKNQLEFHPESHFSKILIHLFDDQDDYLIEAMVCTLDVTSGISFRNNAFPELISILNPVYTFLEFLNLTTNITDLLLDLLISTETCFLLYLLRFLKYIRLNWSMFTQSCMNYYQHNNFNNASMLLQNIHNSNIIINNNSNNIILDNAMTVLINLRLQISRLVAETLFPYNIGPILRLIENCESLYEGNELS